jgi:hypothetical protein
VNLDLRRPKTLEETIDACVAKIRNEAQGDTDTIVEVMVGTEMILDLACRILALEERLANRP